MQNGWCTEKLFLFLYFNTHILARIGSTIIEKIRKYHIENKVISITLDNTSANNSGIDIMKPMIQLNLGGLFFTTDVHVFNLIVQDGFRFIKPRVESIKYIICYIFSSPYWKQAWKQLENSWNNKRFFRVSYEATLFFSGLDYPTSTQVLYHFYEINLTFEKYIDIVFKDMRIIMEKKCI